MKLNYQQIKDITLGAAYVEQIDDRTVLHRFTREQEELYKSVDRGFYNKAFSTSCITLEFETDSTTLLFKSQVKPRSSRRFFSHDVFVDNTLCVALKGEFDADEDIEKGRIVESKITLGEKGIKKEVRINLPWSCSSDIIEISIDDGATLIPTKKSRKMLLFGDSITQGYDAEYTSNSYASQITRVLDAEARNKGIGGEIFRPELASLKDEGFEPDIITVAYGTNDWATEVARDTFVGRINEFFDELTRNYPNAKIFIISPIWRADWMDNHSFGDFSDIRKELQKIANKHQSIRLIDGFNFVLQDCELFSDKYLHPNDEGFKYYAKSLANELSKYL